MGPLFNQQEAKTSANSSTRFSHESSGNIETAVSSGEDIHLASH